MGAWHKYVSEPVQHLLSVSCVPENAVGQHWKADEGLS